MTDCKAKKGGKSREFRKIIGRIKGRKLEVNFKGGTVSSDAGGYVLCRMVEERLRLCRKVAEAIPDKREPGKVKHQYEEMIFQRVAGLVQGYEDLNDHNQLRKDNALKVVMGKEEEDLSSAPTMCRFENRPDRKALVRVARIFVEHFIESFKRTPKELIFDLDTSDIPIHGEQEKRFFHGYYDEYCYLPLYIYCGRKLVLPYLRPSNIDPAKHSRAIIKLLVEYIRQRWPRVKITIRGDSGFCRWRLMKWCEKNEVYYIFGLARNNVLLEDGEKLLKKAEAKYQKSKEKARLFGEFLYAAGTWNTRRRIIMKAEHNEKGSNPRYVVTNVPGMTPQEIYDDLYCLRGEMENRIKEQQLFLFGLRTSAHKFNANQWRVYLSALAYVFMEHIRSHALKATEYEHSYVTTIREKFCKIAAVVTSNTRRIFIALSSCHPMRELYCKIILAFSSA